MNAGLEWPWSEWRAVIGDANHTDAICDWLLLDAERRALTDVIEDRAERASTLVGSQLRMMWSPAVGSTGRRASVAWSALQLDTVWSC